MHPVFFDMKQGHLSAVRFERDWTLRVALTPARHDMLRALVQNGGAMLQSQLRHILAVTRPVISIMIRALERLGFVTRERCPWDRRTFILRLTRRAAIALREVFCDMTRDAFLPFVLGVVFSKDAGFMRDGWETALDRFRRTLYWVRKNLGLGLTTNPWDAAESDEEFYYADEDDNPNRELLVPSWEERLEYDPNAPFEIEDEPIQISAITGWPMLPPEQLEKLQADVRARREARKRADEEAFRARIAEHLQRRRRTRNERRRAKRQSSTNAPNKPKPPAMATASNTPSKMK